MDSFPAFFPLAGRTVIIAGQGEAAEAKARLFEGSPAALVRLYGEAALDSTAYRGACLAFIAGPDADFRRGAAQAARAAGVPVNVVDDPALCDFVTPSVIDRGEVVAAIGTGGASPVLAGLLRQDIEARVPEGAGRVAALFRAAQDQVREALPELDRRRAFLRAALTGPAARAAMDGNLAEARTLLTIALAEAVTNGRAPGRVDFLKAAGPAELLSLRAVRALAQAEILVIAEGCDTQIIALARRDALRRTAAETPISALADLARGGATLVRLTPEDPTAEDINTLHKAGLAFEILPVAQGRDNL